MSDDSSLSDVVALDDGEWEELYKHNFDLYLSYIFWSQSSLDYLMIFFLGSGLFLP